MNILILGNGDLAHKLSTSYKDSKVHGANTSIILQPQQKEVVFM